MKNILRYISIVIIFLGLKDIGICQYNQTTIQTPRGTSVTAGVFTGTDWNSTQKAELRSDWEDYYYNKDEYEIIFQSGATKTYNCHAFAWWVSEGGNIVWLNTPGDDEFWDDGSYYEVISQSNATKVSFGGPCTYYSEEWGYSANWCDHSAITTGYTDFFISKWGNSPAFASDKDHCPYDPQDLHYYARPSISGPTMICSSGGTFSVQDFLYVTYSWTTSDNIQISGSSTGRSVTVVPKSNQYEAGPAYVRITIDGPGTPQTITKNINSMIIAPSINHTYPPAILDFVTNFNTSVSQSCNTISNYKFYIEPYTDPFYTGASPISYTFNDDFWSPGYVEVYCKAYDNQGYFATSSPIEVQLVPHDTLFAEITGDEFVCLDGWGWFESNASGGVGNLTYEWYLDDEYVDDAQTFDREYPFDPWYPSSHHLDLIVYDEETYIEVDPFYFQLGWCERMRGDSIQLYPNPANEYIDVTVVDTSNPESTMDLVKSKNSEVYTFYVIDNYGKTLYQKKTTEKYISISTANFISGNYHVKVLSSKGITDKKFIISH